MPPEVIVGDPADERSDIYGLGLVLYAMLAGRPAYEQRANAVQTFHEVLASEAPGLQAHRPNLSGAVVELVAKAMARDSHDRFRTASLMRDALRPVLEAARVNPSVHPPSTVQPVSSSLTGPQRAVDTSDLD